MPPTDVGVCLPSVPLRRPTAVHAAGFRWLKAAHAADQEHGDRAAASVSRQHPHAPGPHRSVDPEPQAEGGRAQRRGRARRQRRAQPERLVARHRDQRPPHRGGARGRVSRTGPARRGGCGTLPRCMPAGGRVGNACGGCFPHGWVRIAEGVGGPGTAGRAPLGGSLGHRHAVRGLRECACMGRRTGMQRGRGWGRARGAAGCPRLRRAAGHRGARPWSVRGRGALQHGAGQHTGEWWPLS